MFVGFLLTGTQLPSQLNIAAISVYRHSASPTEAFALMMF